MQTSILQVAVLLAVGLPEALPAEDLLANGSAEEVLQGKPVRWNVYQGGRKADWGISRDAHSGKAHHAKNLKQLQLLPEGGPK